MSSNIVTMRCPSCNAPFPAGSSNKSEIVCAYCGQVTYNNYTEEQQNDNSNPINVILPNITDAECKETLINTLVLTDYVPIDVFDSFDIEDTRHHMYPVYVFNVNWSANWSAVYSQRVSHEEPTYDYNGNRTGKTTVYETQYRDANGTSAGDCKVILPGLMEGFPNQSKICEKCTDFDSELEIDRIDSRILEWELYDPNIDDEKAWKKGGEEALVEHVDTRVLLDVYSMANGWGVDRKNYTYRYSYGDNHCVLIPIWESDFRYAEKSYSASVDTRIGGKAYWEEYPKDETVEDLKVKTDEEISSYKSSRTAGYVCFGIFSALTILFLALPSFSEFSENRVMFCAMFVFAIVSWVLTRNVQRKKLNLENKFKNKLWDDKVKRSEAAEKKFGIKVDIGEEPEKLTMERGVDALVYGLFGIVFFIAITQGLFAGINRKQHTRSQPTYQHSTNTATRNNNNTTTTYQQPAKSTNNTSQKTVVSSSENGTSSIPVFPYNTYFTGTIGSKGNMRIDRDGSGSYTYDCNGTDLTRNIKVKSYDSQTGHLLIESYDKSGKYIGEFDGYTNNGNSYSGTFTNYKGGTVKFQLQTK